MLRVVIVSKFEIDDKQAEKFYLEGKKMLPEGYELLDFVDGKYDVSLMRQGLEIMSIGD